jgi:hypothetical protein
MKPKLTTIILQQEANKIASKESSHWEKALYGVTDGKAVGTYFEHKFRSYLKENYTFVEGTSAQGIDFPKLNVDMKVTSIRQPQSSCPYKSARQKIFGLGYSLLIFVYEKKDNQSKHAGNLDIRHVIFIDSQRTGDYQMTRVIKQTIENEGSIDDIIAIINDRNLQVDEIQANEIAQEVLKKPPEQGYLTISNALQWRLQYSRVIQQAGIVEGIVRVR